MNLYYDRQDCLNHQRLRMDFWPEATTMQSKLYGTIGDLRRDFWPEATTMQRKLYGTIGDLRRTA